METDSMELRINSLASEPILFIAKLIQCVMLLCGRWSGGDSACGWCC